MIRRKTKIVATISDRRCDTGFIRSLYEAGMDVARINTAHVTIESADRLVKNIREVSDDIAIMVDTKGPEIRLTALDEKWKDGIPVKTGDIVNLKGTAENKPSSPEMIYTNDASLYDDIPAGASILIDDGDIELTVEEKRDGVLRCRVDNGGTILSRKSVNAPGVEINLPSVTARDREFIEWAVSRGLDFIAHSFVRTAQDVMAVTEILAAHDSDIKVISKIENRQGVENIDEILKVTYGIMVARGDLGVEVPAEELPIVQRMIVRKCIESKSPVIIATQMLQSMMHSPRPTRAEVSDIASAVYQRADAVMLSGETASGDYPVEAVLTMGRVALSIEEDNGHNEPYLDLSMSGVNNEITAQLARSTVRATINLPVKAVVCDTLSGRTGRYLAAFRGQRPVYAMCYRPTVMRQLALSFGIRPMYSEPFPEHSAFIKEILERLKGEGELSSDDLIAVMGGDFGAAAGASFLEIGYVRQLEEKARGYGLLHGNDDTK